MADTATSDPTDSEAAADAAADADAAVEADDDAAHDDGAVEADDADGDAASACDRAAARATGAPGGQPPDVWRLRSRGCWTEAAEALAPHCAAHPGAALERAALLVERCMFTARGWEEAEYALRLAEAVARTDEERGEAACERGHLAFTITLFGVRDRADEARAALGRCAALLAPEAAGRPLLDFRRGLIAQLLSDDPVAARAAFRRAHAGAAKRGDALLRSYTWRHLAALAAQDGDLAEARRGFAESLRIRVETGFLVGVAPALVALAEVQSEPEASRLLAEASRLHRLLDGVPVWLKDALASEA